MKNKIFILIFTLCGVLVSTPPSEIVVRYASGTVLGTFSPGPEARTYNDCYDQFLAIIKEAKKNFDPRIEEASITTHDCKKYTLGSPTIFPLSNQGGSIAVNIVFEQTELGKTMDYLRSVRESMFFTQPKPENSAEQYPEACSHVIDKDIIIGFVQRCSYWPDQIRTNPQHALDKICENPDDVSEMTKYFWIIARDTTGERIIAEEDTTGERIISCYTFDDTDRDRDITPAIHCFTGEQSALVFNKSRDLIYELSQTVDKTENPVDALREKLLMENPERIDPNHDWEKIIGENVWAYLYLKFNQVALDICAPMSFYDVKDWEKMLIEHIAEIEWLTIHTVQKKESPDGDYLTCDMPIIRFKLSGDAAHRARCLHEIIDLAKRLEIEEIA